MTRDFGSATLGGYIVVKFEKERARWGERGHGELDGRVIYTRKIIKRSYLRVSLQYNGEFSRRY